MDCEKEWYKEHFVLLRFNLSHVQFFKIKVNDGFCFDISIVDLIFFISVIVKPEVLSLEFRKMVENVSVS